MTTETYRLRVVSVAINRAIGGRHETVCARIGRNALNGHAWAQLVQRVLDSTFGACHCKAAWEYQRKLEISRRLGQ
jgi:hypothetical protein